MSLTDINIIPEQSGRYCYTRKTAYLKFKSNKQIYLGSEFSLQVNSSRITADQIFVHKLGLAG